METSDAIDTVPLASATLVLGTDDWYYRWRVSCCPLCGRTHYHGGGPIWEDPRRLLTHKVKHCSTRYLRTETARRMTGYVLADKNPKRTIRMMQELE